MTMVTRLFKTEDGYTFYEIDDNRIIDSLDITGVDMEFNDYDHFEAHIGGAFVSVEHPDQALIDGQAGGCDLVYNVYTFDELSESYAPSGEYFDDYDDAAEYGRLEVGVEWVVLAEKDCRAQEAERLARIEEAARLARIEARRLEEAKEERLITWGLVINDEHVDLQGVHTAGNILVEQKIHDNTGILITDGAFDILMSWLYECGAEIGDTRTFTDEGLQYHAKLHGIRRELSDRIHAASAGKKTPERFPKKGSVLEYFNRQAGNLNKLTYTDTCWETFDDLELSSNVGMDCQALIDAAAYVHNNTADVIEPAVDWPMIATQCYIYYTG